MANGLLLFESSYYVAPEERASKPYALFMAALQETKSDFVAKVAKHNREHVVLIRPAAGGLVVHRLYYEDELHKGKKAQAPKSKFSGKELDPLIEERKKGQDHDDQATPKAP